MKITLEPGKYVVAVSGGVDSVVLLDLVAHQKDLDIVVAHFDHGIREDSPDDAAFVRALAQDYGLPIEVGEGHLGEDASEAEARDARYAFLKRVANEHHADGVITAHHRDDVIETAVINLTRGTGPRGLCALRTKKDTIRPLLSYTKAELMFYAQKHNLQWHEDSTNRALKYRRNYVRLKLIPAAVAADSDFERRMLSYINRTAELIEEIDVLEADVLKQHFSGEDFERHVFIMLPHIVAKEIMAAVLKRAGVTNMDRAMLERLTISVKTGRANTEHDIDKELILRLNSNTWAIVKRGKGRAAQT